MYGNGVGIGLTNTAAVPATILHAPIAARSVCFGAEAGTMTSITAGLRIEPATRRQADYSTSASGSAGQVCSLLSDAIVVQDAVPAEE